MTATSDTVPAAPPRVPFDDPGVDAASARKGALVIAILLALPALAVATWRTEQKFREIDRRIDTALPKARGIEAAPTVAGDDEPSIRVVLARVAADDPGGTRTTVTKISLGDREWFLPAGAWTEDPDSNRALQAKRDAVFGDLASQIKGMFATNKDLKGEIEAPLPKGQAVPHADIMAVLDAFIAAGMKEVNFVGAPVVLPRPRTAPRR